MSEYWGWDGMSEGLVAECSLKERMPRNIGGNAVDRAELEKEENSYPLSSAICLRFFNRFSILWVNHPANQ